MSFVFAPELRIFEHDGIISVMFDTLSPLDAKRATSIVMFSKCFDRLSFSLNEIHISSVSGSDKCTFACKILLVTHVGTQEKTYELADCQFVIPVIGKTKTGPILMPADQIEHLIRQGVADALTAAYGEYALVSDRAIDYPVHALNAPHVPGAVGRGDGDSVSTAVAAASRRVSGRAAANDDKSYRRKMMLAVVGAPLLIWFVAWGGSKLFAPSSVESAVARAMAHDPQAVAAQVELTRQTLQQMGLDPGKASDLGCFAP